GGGGRGGGGAARLTLTADATGETSNVAAADVNISGRVYADDGAALAALAGIDRAVAVDKRPASLGVTATGRPGELRVDGRLTAARLEAAAKGTLNVLGDEAVAGTIDLKFAAADALVLH